MEEGIVYILTNPAMPGLVKIGKTTRETVNARLYELYSTGVPVPFECAFAGKVDNVSKVERAFHQAFGPYRLNPKREFFEIESGQAVALLELMTDENLTPEMQSEAEAVDVESKDAVAKLKSKRPRFNFEEMGIPVGSSLIFTRLNQSVEVASDRKVFFEGEESSLTAVTRKLMETEYNLAPGPYWTFEGRLLSDIYDKTYRTV